MERCAKKERLGGQVRVAKYYPNKPMPKTPNFKNVLIHTTAKGVGGPLSPYVLKDENGALLENIWQFSKLYPEVASQRIAKSRYHPDNIIWEHPAELHADPDTGEPNDAFWAWREKGLRAANAVRYPNGYKGRHACVCAIWPNDPTSYEKLTYIEARKRIYCAEYARLAPQTEAFRKLQGLLNKGRNLQIVEVDGPDPTLDYAPYDRIDRDNPGLLMDEETVKMLLEDERKPFGHGYTIAALLLGGEEWIIK